MIYSDAISKAIIISARAHEGQYRKGSTNNPYVEHPFSVALISQKYIDDEEVFIAALLHDILEDVSDKKYSRADMQRDFGATVLGIVEDVTEPDITEPTEEAWLERKQSYIDHLAEVNDIRPLIVSTADKIHNMSEIILSKTNRSYDYILIATLILYIVAFIIDITMVRDKKLKKDKKIKKTKKIKTKKILKNAN